MARLARKDWLDHGLTTLAAEGFTGLKADSLARSLDVSRGSFYWHFDDLAEFHTSLLQRWLEVSVLAVIERLEGDGLAPAPRLRALVRAAVAGDSNIEQAVRAWAFADSTVSDMLAEVDRQRVDYIASIIAEAGIATEVARRRALLLYLSSIGYSAAGHLVDGSTQDKLIDELLDIALDGGNGTG